MSTTVRVKTNTALQIKTLVTMNAAKSADDLIAGLIKKYCLDQLSEKDRIIMEQIIQRHQEEYVR